MNEKMLLPQVPQESDKKKINKEEINYSIFPFTDLLEDTIKHMQKVARQRRETLIGQLEGVKIIIKPESYSKEDPKDLHADYLKRLEAFQASPKGKKYAEMREKHRKEREAEIARDEVKEAKKREKYRKEREAEIARDEVKEAKKTEDLRKLIEESERETAAAIIEIQKLLRNLPKLDFNDPKEVLNWSRSFFENLVVSASVDEKEIISIFIEHGFKPNDAMGSKYDPEDEKVVFKYIIGQMLQGLKKNSLLENVMLEMINAWEKKFGKKKKKKLAPKG